MPLPIAIVGKTIAFQWYARGCRTLDDVKARKGGIMLTAAQEIGLKFYEGEFPSCLGGA